MTTRAISIQNLNLFRWVAKDNPPPPMVRAFTTGYWNVFDHTGELESYLTAHGVSFVTYADKYELLRPAPRRS